MVKNCYMITTSDKKGHINCTLYAAIRLHESSLICPQILPDFTESYHESVF